MRLHRGVPMVAAVLTLTGTFVPAASAYMRVGTPAAYGQPTTLVHRQSSGSDDWAIEIGTVGAITILGTGVAVTRRGRKPASLPARIAS
jgi:hypothetical protein